MRDYKGSGNMTLRRRRRRAPWGLLALVVILAAAAIGGYLAWDRMDLLTPTSTIVKSERERGVIPLAIPGQEASTEPDTAE
ncbi:MAG: hypothetical protein GVY22_04345 [Gammaproteobacteria bacterium]|jgi:hypothetical protein|nr:hypothetical protein [Gammaproteobacteria bacterium]